jgi:hypothetical protein
MQKMPKGIKCVKCQQSVRKTYARIACDNVLHVSYIHLNCFRSQWNKLNCVECGNQITHYGKCETKLTTRFIKYLTTRKNSKNHEYTQYCM